MNKGHIAWVCALWVVMGSPALAQTRPDAGALMRQTEQLLRPNAAWTPHRESLPPAMDIHEHTQIEVKRIQFFGNQQLSTEQLQAIAGPFEHRILNQADLLHLTHAVSEAYRQTGWVVNVYVPRQRSSGGDLRLQVVETVPPAVTR